MPSTRRNFLKTSGLSVAALAIGSQKLFAEAGQDIYLGIQLYSVRDDMSRDPSGTLKKVSDLGYRYVEHANYHNRKFYGYTPKEFKKLLGGYNMKMPSGHVVMTSTDYDYAKKDFTDNWKHTIEDAAIAGQLYLISPSLDDSLFKTMKDFMQYMDVFNKSGELCKKSGMKFGYHNHDFEFKTHIEGKELYDLIMQNTDPALVTQQLDMGNLYNGGVKAIDIVNRYPGRYELMHVKDEILSTEKTDDKYISTILGKGIVGTREICDIGKKSGGTEYFIVEQESYQGLKPIDCCGQDFLVMKSWGY
jgi:sugar phosphate isomerase/epimerase